MVQRQHVKDTWRTRCRQGSTGRTADHERARMEAKGPLPVSECAAVRDAGSAPLRFPRLNDVQLSVAATTCMRLRVCYIGMTAILWRTTFRHSPRSPRFRRRAIRRHATLIFLARSRSRTVQSYTDHFAPAGSHPAKVVAKHCSRHMLRVVGQSMEGLCGGHWQRSDCFPSVFTRSISTKWCCA